MPLKSDSGIVPRRLRVPILPKQMPPRIQFWGLPLQWVWKPRCREERPGVWALTASSPASGRFQSSLRSACLHVRISCHLLPSGVLCKRCQACGRLAGSFRAVPRCWHPMDVVRGLFVPIQLVATLCLQNARPPGEHWESGHHPDVSKRPGVCHCQGTSGCSVSFPFVFLSLAQHRLGFSCPGYSTINSLNGVGGWNRCLHRLHPCGWNTSLVCMAVGGSLPGPGV